jgi:hypothetical protein
MIHNCLLSLHMPFPEAYSVNLELHLGLREPNISNMQSLLDICSPVVSRLRGRRTPPSEIPKLNTLAGLPVELLLSITDFLPLDDWICISLRSRRFFAIFNHRTNSARPSGKDKLPLLRHWNEIYRNTSFAMFAIFFISMMAQNASVYLSSQYLTRKNVLFDASQNREKSALI